MNQITEDNQAYIRNYLLYIAKPLSAPTLTIVQVLFLNDKILYACKTK